MPAHTLGPAPTPGKERGAEAEDRGGARDSKGRVRVPQSMCRVLSLDPLMAGAFACLWYATGSNQGNRVQLRVASKIAGSRSWPAR